MTQLLFANNATTTLAGSISSSSTSVALASGTGALFPNPSAGQGFYMTFNDAATGLLTEIVLCTSRSGDTCTIVRGQQGTAAQAWNPNDLASQFNTAGDQASFLQTVIATGRLLSAPVVHSATAAGITFPAGTNNVLMIAIGSGGGGADTGSTTSGQQECGSGGGSGAYFEAWVPIAQANGCAVTIGAAGVHNANGGNVTVTLADLSTLTAYGGMAGQASAASSTNIIAGGVAASAIAAGAECYLVTGGFISENGFALGTSALAGGAGGAHPSFGTGGGGASTGSPNGSNGQGYGAGGGGAVSAASSGSGHNGGSGTAGCVIMYPFS